MLETVSSHINDAIMIFAAKRLLEYLGGYASYYCISTILNEFYNPCS